MTERQILLLYDAEQRRLSHHRANQFIDKIGRAHV